MNNQRIAAWLKGASLSMILSLHACSPASYTSTESLIGGLTGGAIGSGIGYYFGDTYGNMTDNVMLNGAPGAGIGILGGAMLADRNLVVERQREIVKREAELIDQNQRELDILRTGLYDSTSWGGNETKPWDLRYPAEDAGLPYEG
ncbi:MAG TPA: hypothetical protein PLP17_09990, partial [Oligoflexia bacterium]|nr:hypothetical protein [Oligoflexia bacterium]